MTPHYLFKQQVTDLKRNLIRTINGILNLKGIEEIDLKSLIVINSNEYGNECISSYNSKLGIVYTVVVSDEMTNEDDNDTYRLEEIELDHILALLYEVENENYEIM